MKTFKIFAVGALAATALMGFGCRDTTTTTPGTGGSGAYGRDNPGADDKKLGDGKIGRNNGVIDDGEGPLENMGHDGKADDKIGNNPGVWHDGEGPFEKNDAQAPDRANNSQTELDHNGSTNQ